MKTLVTITDKDINPEYIEKKKGSVKFRERQAARALLFDKDNKIALMYVSKSNYYKLPGGGVDPGENIEQGLRRECLEEAGCNINIGDEVGKIIEYRNYDQWGNDCLHQESYCYLAKVKGDKGTVNFDSGEIEEGFKLVWVSLDEALELLKKSQPTTYDGPFVVKRDLVFLEEARKLINKL